MGRQIGARPAGECTCDRAVTENSKISGATCACGQRAASKPFPMLTQAPTLTLALDACSCEKAADGGQLPTETDFTTKASGA